MATIRGKGFWAVIALLVLITTYCTGMPIGQSGLRVANLEELRAYLLSNKPDIERFRDRGPFRFTVKNDIELVLPEKDRIKADLYLAAPGGKAPLVILLHGYGNSKADHANQAIHLATWGFHSLAVSLPNRGPWTANGNKLLSLVSMIRAKPELIDSRIDPERIILAGHSFGASAIAVTMGKDAPAAGAILLDPAGIGRTIPPYLRRIRAPVVVIASDERLVMTRNRGYFFANIPANIVRVSIANASHEDAQFPILPVVQSADSDTAPVEELQITFTSALTAAALSLGLTGRSDYAWEGFAEGVKSGRLFDPMRK